MAAAAIKEGFHETFREVLPEIRYAFAYGSAIQQQAGYDTARMSKAMVDMMLVVPDTAAFHAANLQHNAGHYSWLMRNAGSPFRQVVQNAGAGVFFNTDIPFQGRRAKYGIVSTEDFLEDCQFWRKLYVAGRLQKPILELKGEGDPEIKLQLQINRNSAFAVALLMLPETFSTFELLEKIVSISYIGDIRSGLAEHPNKIRNIVEGQYDALWNWYAPVVPFFLHSHCNKLYAKLSPVLDIKPGVILRAISGNRWQQDMDPKVRLLRVSCTPLNKMMRVEDKKKDVETVIRWKLRRIAWWPSAVQSAKGLLTANPRTAARYLGDKLSKRFAA